MSTKFNRTAEILNSDGLRRKSDHIAFDRIYNGNTYHHTGYDVWIGQWLYEFYCPETDDIIYF